MDHERHRFSYMSMPELNRRLSRISKPEKLLNFAVMAEEQGYDELARSARAKFERLTGHKVAGTGASVGDVSGRRELEKEKKKKPLVRVIRD